MSDTGLEEGTSITRVRDQLAKKVKFTASAQPEDRNKALDAITKQAIHPTPPSPHIQEIYARYYRDRSLPQNEEIYLSKMIKNAESKLRSLGFSNADQMLPVREQITIREIIDESENQVGGEVGEYLEHIRIDLPKSKSIQECEDVFYHELCHFISGEVVTVTNHPSKHRIYQAQGDKFRQQLFRGFQRVTDEETVPLRGIPEEGIPDLFAAFCIEGLVVSVYNIQSPFMVTFITDYASKKGVSAMQAFTAIIQANVCRDYTFQKDLVAVYGRAFVRKLNNLGHTYGGEGFREAISDLANVGGFQTAYENCRKDFNLGKPITFEGLKGSVIKGDFTWE